MTACRVDLREGPAGVATRRGNDAARAARLSPWRVRSTSLCRGHRRAASRRLRRRWHASCRCRCWPRTGQGLAHVDPRSRRHQSVAGTRPRCHCRRVRRRCGIPARRRDRRRLLPQLRSSRAREAAGSSRRGVLPVRPLNGRAPLPGASRLAPSRPLRRPAHCRRAVERRERPPDRWGMAVIAVETTSVVDIQVLLERIRAAAGRSAADGP